VCALVVFNADVAIPAGNRFGLLSGTAEVIIFSMVFFLN